MGLPMFTESWESVAMCNSCGCRAARVLGAGDLLADQHHTSAANRSRAADTVDALRHGIATARSLWQQWMAVAA